jgi:hypothetical protein
MDSVEARVKRAMTADGTAIRGMLRDPSDKVVMALLVNRNITEEELIVLARRRDMGSDVLGMIAGMKAAVKEYRLMSVLVNNPKTPRRAALGLIRRLRLRDMALVTQNKALPTELRQAAEGVLRDKLPSVPLGVKVGLARQVSDELLKTLLLEDDPMQLKACFENPRMKEAVVLWALNHERVPANVVNFIASHPKWSAYYAVRFALVRNRHTPVEKSAGFAIELKSMDQRFLYNDPAVPAAVKAHIQIELERKGQPLFPPREEGRTVGIPEAYELDDDNANAG